MILGFSDLQKEEITTASKGAIPDDDIRPKKPVCKNDGSLPGLLDHISVRLNDENSTGQMHSKAVIMLVK